MRFTALFLAVLFCLTAHADIATERSSDEILIAEAEKLVRDESATAGATTTATSVAATANTEATAAATEISPAAAAIAEKSKSESEIPVFADVKKAAKSEGSFVWRLVASVGFMGVVAIAMVFAGKKCTAKKNVGGQKTRIEVLHQIHFGPKKTLGLIRVAGEVILLGMTDQTITMLKSVVLIDEELENTMNTDFNKFLNDDFAVEDIRSAISSRA